jgi:hypothetical protein
MRLALPLVLAFACASVRAHGLNDPAHQTHRMGDFKQGRLIQ